MDASALLSEYRRRADDAAAQGLVTDEQAIGFLAEAEREAAERANLLWDDSHTNSITRYSITAGQPIVKLSPLIYRIDAASFVPSSGGNPANLGLVGIDWIRDQCQWQTQGGQPRVLAHVGRTEGRLYPNPNAGGTLQLDAYRLPRNPIEDLDDEPEIPEEYHLDLVEWMLYRTYTSKDGEQEDPERAKAALSAFIERFGERRSANASRKQRERRRVTTRYCG